MRIDFVQIIELWVFYLAMIIVTKFDGVQIIMGSVDLVQIIDVWVIQSR